MGKLLLTLSGNNPINAPTELFKEIATSLDSEVGDTDVVSVGTWCCVIPCEYPVFLRKEYVMRAYLNGVCAMRSLRAFSYKFENMSV